MNYSLIISIIALLLSAFTLWHTHLHHGRLEMTKPTLIFMAFERPSRRPKVFIRTLLFSSGARGWVIESLYLRVHQDGLGISHLFDIWGHSDGRMTLGSGLFVKPEGGVYDHHFNPRESENFIWWDGAYRVEVFARLFGKTAPRKLREFSFVLRSDQAAELAQVADAGAFIELNAETQEYVSHIDHQRMP